MNRYLRELSVAGALGLLLVAMAVFAPGFYQPQMQPGAERIAVLTASIAMVHDFAR